MTEEERRRCIIFGICGPGGGAPGGQGERRQALRESLEIVSSGFINDEHLDYILGLIDEAKSAKAKAKPKAKKAKKK